MNEYDVDCLTADDDAFMTATAMPNPEDVQATFPNVKRGIRYRRIYVRESV